MARGVYFTVRTHGLFFKNPIGRLRRNEYDIVKEVAAFALQEERSQLVPGHGYLTGELWESLRAKPIPARRGSGFRAEGAVIAGRSGFEMVRHYAWKVERKYHFVRRAARLARGWVTSNRGRIKRDLARGLS